MEHGTAAVMEELIMIWAQRNSVTITAGQSATLIRYAEEIAEKNRQFNLTGFKTSVEVLENLVIGSLEPLLGMNVPRGTLFADIGTGSGIPGVPLGIFFGDLRGVLFDSSEKKMGFVRSVVEKLHLENLSVMPGRIEERAREEALRKRFNLVVSRAFGPLYIVVELAAPLLAAGGLLYIYASEEQKNIDENVLRHAGDVGLTLAVVSERRDAGVGETGILFVKKGVTEDRYPRRYAVIKREAQLI